jgi:hypothetical protein
MTTESTPRDPTGKLMQDELVDRDRNAWADAQRYRWLSAHARSTTEHWGGRWSLVIDGPAPTRKDCADALDEAVDAAMALSGWPSSLTRRRSRSD